MKKNSFAFLSGMLLLVFSWSNSLLATEATLEQQEAILDSELSNATTSEQITNITVALAQIKKQQTTREFKKIPDMIGRERSFLSSSIKESFTYRQMASSFQNEPARTSVAYSYHVGNFLGMCCIFLGMISLIVRSKYRY